MEVKYHYNNLKDGGKGVEILVEKGRDGATPVYEIYEIRPHAHTILQTFILMRYAPSGFGVNYFLAETHIFNLFDLNEMFGLELMERFFQEDFISSGVLEILKKEKATTWEKEKVTDWERAKLLVKDFSKEV